MKFVYFYFMTRDIENIKQSAPDHISYWHGLNLAGYEGGPFADRSGGMIVFNCENPTEAEQLVAGDPFVELGLIESSWLKQWAAA